MAWPPADITQENTDQSTDQPKQARAQLNTALQYVNDIRTARAMPNGVASLNSSGHIPAAQLAKTLLLTGGFMTGNIHQHALPALPQHLVTKGYVDTQVSTGGFVTGTKLLFAQTLAPSGWTKDTTHNNKGIRLTTGTVTSGGTDSFTTTFSPSKTTASHALSVAQMPSHNHGGTTASAKDDIRDGVTGGGSVTHEKVQVNSVFEPSNSTFRSDIFSGHSHTITAQGSNSGHTHNMTMDLQYHDVIMASKN